MISDKEIKDIGIETLDFLADFCQKHDMTYYLAYGTLLGAVRHKGYIPWDDDIDVWMFRHDYDRFLELRGELNDTLYELIAPEVNPQFETPFAKLCRKDTEIEPCRFINGFMFGLGLDIFPVDAVSEEKDEAKVHEEFLATRNKHLQILKKYGRYTFGTENKPFRKALKKMMHTVSNKIFGPVDKKVLDYERAYADRKLNENTTFLGIMDEVHVFPKEWFDGIIELEFEGKKYNAPYHYDEILHRMYGDYMVPPPEDQRVSPHNLKAYYINK